MPFDELECPLRVSIANEHGVYASLVYGRCQLEIFGVIFPIDLIPILRGEVCVIVGMDRLSRFSDIIECKGQRVVYFELQVGENWLSSARAPRWVQGSAQPPGLNIIVNMGVRVV